MKLLVLAQIPPPVHGQSIMVQTLVTGLPSHGVDVHHINLGLSRDAADIGRWRPGKVIAVLAACLHAAAARFRRGCDTLYYVPAPGKRGAIYRDWCVMLLCRPLFPRLVLHWHAAGLAAWMSAEATGVERWLTRRLLRGADLSIVLSESLRADAEAFQPKAVRVVPNGIADPAANEGPRPGPDAGPCQVLFLGLCCEEKGLFAAAAAVLSANRSARAPKAEPRFTLVAAGPFADYATGARFNDLCADHPATLRYAGPVHGTEKDRLLRTSACLCLPSRYAPEGQPLVLLEAMAHDLPIIATRWRAIPDTVPPEAGLVDIGDSDALATALIQLRKHPPAPGIFRRYFLTRFTVEIHLAAIAAALKTAG
jgi:glycosyltransferase involved in cell wall biosynthesis